MRIKIRHEIVQRFDPSARRVIEALRLTPRSHEGQHVLEWRIDVEADCRLRRAEDAFGNLADMFSLQAPPSQLRLVAEGAVETFDCAGVVRGALERFPPDLFLRDTLLTAPDAAMRGLAPRRGPDAAAAVGGPPPPPPKPPPPPHCCPAPSNWSAHAKARQASASVSCEHL